MPRERGLGPAANNLFNKQVGSRGLNTEVSSDPFGIKSLVPSIEQMQNRDNDPQGYRSALAKLRSRNDGLEQLTSPNSSPRNLSSYDTDYGPGYEVVDPAKSSDPFGRARAQKIGYNKELKYLAILMRDGNMIGYPGVTQDEWDEYSGFTSTSDYIDMVLSRYRNGNWEKLSAGSLPQSNPQSFTQGTTD